MRHLYPPSSSSSTDSNCGSSMSSQSMNRSASRFRATPGRKLSNLTQPGDGKISRQKKFTFDVNKQSIDNYTKKLNTRSIDSDYEVESIAKISNAELERYRVRDRSGRCSSPCPRENLQRLKNASSPSITRKREKKQRAEQKMMDLLTASGSYCDDSSGFGSSISGSVGSRSTAVSSSMGILSSSSGESSERHLSSSINRLISNSSSSEGPKLIRPKPRRISHGSPPLFRSTPWPVGRPENVLQERVNTIDSNARTKAAKEVSTEVKSRVTEQMDIIVLDNFFTFMI